MPFAPHAISALLAFVVACQPQPAIVGVRDIQLPPDSAGQCANLCQQIGLRAESVVTMANFVGCVCRAPSPSASSSDGAAAASAGGVVALMLAAQATQATQAAQARAQAAQPNGR